MAAIECTTCRFWDETQGDMQTLGECHRRSPLIESAMDLVMRDGLSEAASQVESGPWGRWPWTKKHWWCGDHESRVPGHGQQISEIE